MKHLLISLFLSCGLLIDPVWAGEVREFALHDGSVISAEMLSLQNGVYTLRSESLGTFNIEASKIRTIRLSTASEHAQPAASPLPSSVDTQIRHLQQTMLGNPAIMELISSLLQHPDVQAVLADPEILQAVAANDFSTLLANPKFMQLLNNPTMQEIGKKTKP